jgi:SAM-dependent methyltransferase
MPTQELLSYLYSCGSRSVIGDWPEPSLSVPERFCIDREQRSAAGNYFELGVGQGNLYRYFCDRGWKCAGVDPGAWSSGFPNIYRDLADVPLSVKADLLIANDVLEHVADPVSILKQLRRIARPGALLYCATPNRQSLRARYHRQNWRMLRPLGHVNYYSKASIILAMRNAGFEITLLRKTDLEVVQFPRQLRDLKALFVELTGSGDQWMAACVAV